MRESPTSIALFSILFACLAAAGLYTTKSCPANEVYLKCGPNCQTECTTLGATCQIIHKKCPDGCYCKAGYARNTCGQCIPEEECSIY